MQIGLVVLYNLIQSVNEDTQPFRVRIHKHLCEDLRYVFELAWSQFRARVDVILERHETILSLLPDRAGAERYYLIYVL